jgi:hypothetical protein
MISEGKTEEAISILSSFYGVEKPKLKVGIPKGKYKALALYDPSKNIIYFSRGEYMYNAFIVLHEFYHVIRMWGNKHKGNEKKANEFALSFLKRLYKVK